MSFITGAIVGWIVGYVIFKRPQWSTDFIAWMKKKVGF